MPGIIKAADLVDGQRSGILFLCSGNSSRSQMAEGFARFLGPSHVRIYSAGSKPEVLDPLAVKAMNEVGVDISGHSSKSLEEVPMPEIALVVTLCAEDECPPLPEGMHRVHWQVEDPVGEAGLALGGEDPLQGFRRARDQIRELVSALF